MDNQGFLEKAKEDLLKDFNSWGLEIPEEEIFENLIRERAEYLQVRQKKKTHESHL